MKRKYVIFYLMFPLLLQWGISFLVQILAILLIGEVAEYALELTTFISFVTIPAAGFVYHRDSMGREKQNGIQIKWSDWLKTACLGSVSCIFLNVLIAVLDLQRFSPVYQEVSEIIYHSSYFLQFLGTVIAAPIVEELIYRGVLYSRIKEVSSVWPAALLSAFIFGICHGNLVQFAFAFGIGVVLCYVYEMYQKLYMPIWVHMIVNLTSLVLSWSLG